MKIIDEYKETKNRLNSIASWLKQEGLLTEEDYNRVLDILSKDKIKIGVAGQMKYGKSTLINALLFKNRVLPTSDIPMTATLTFIDYGDKESYTVEFFTKEEWENIKKVAQMSGDEKEQQAFKEILKEAKVRLGSDIENFLGKKVEVSKENLEEYVGAEGKFTPITKALYIKLPHDILKELILVDTPGFNDPIESREKEAEKFLRDADTLIFLLYAGRALDATDKYLITDKIAKFGTGGLIFVLNKYDILFEEIGAQEKVEEYIEKIINEIVIDEELNVTVRNALKEAPIVKMSSLWALLGTIPESDMTEDDKWYFENHKKKFPFLRTKEDFLKYSGLKELEEKLLETIRERKTSILVNKVKSILEGSVIEKLSKISTEITKKEIEKEMLSANKENIEKQKTEFRDFKRYVFPEIMKYGDELLEIDKLIDKAEYEIKSSLKHIFDTVDFNHIGFFDFGGYREQVEFKVKSAYIEARELVEEKMNKLNEACKSKFQAYIDKKINELLEYKLVKNYTVLSLTHREALKAKLMKEFENSASIEFLEIESPDIGGRFLLFGESKESAKRKALEYKDGIYRKVKNTVEQALKEYRIGVTNFMEKHIIEKIEETVLKPIEEALERTEENLRDKDSRIKQLEQELIKLYNEKKKLEKIKENLEIEFAKTGGIQ